MLVSESHAAAALAQAVGRAVGYDTTALLFIDRDAATLSVVKTDDGSVVKVLSRSLHSTDAMAVLTDMAAAVAAADSAPQGMFVLGAGVDVASVKAHLEPLVSLPVSAPDEPEMALARGAALASANAPAFEATTVGLAYSQDPDGTTAGSAYALAGLATEMAPVGADAIDGVDLVADEMPLDEERKPFLLVGSALTSVFVVGVVALVISLAVSIRPTVDQRPSPAQGRGRAQRSGPASTCSRTGSPARTAGSPATGPAAGDHQGPDTGGAGSSGPGPAGAAAHGLRRAARRVPRRLPPRRRLRLPRLRRLRRSLWHRPRRSTTRRLRTSRRWSCCRPPRLPGLFRPPWEPPQRQEPQRPWDPPSRHEPETPQWPGSGSDDWGPGSGSGPSSGWNPGRSSGVG